MDATSGGQFTVTNADGDTETLDIPATKAPATKLTLDTDLNDSSRKTSDVHWDNNDRSKLIVHYE